MINELQPWLSEAKGSDIVRRLESPDPRQALPAEYELALMWGISKVADLQVEPRIGSRTPDLASRDILRSGPFIADIAAVSDVFSGEATMRRAANIIVDFCSTVNKAVGRHLYFTFLEESGYEATVIGGRHQRAHFRRRKVGKKFSLNDEMRETLRDWLQNVPPAPRIHSNTLMPVPRPASSPCRFSRDLTGNILFPEDSWIPAILRGEQ